jgi:hypothetical protein
METRRWTNPSQPQTLYVATFLLYLNAVLGLLFGTLIGSLLGPLGAIVAIVGAVAAGFGIANEKRWGYILGVMVAGLDLVPFLLYVVNHGVGSIFNVSLLLAALFPVALFALLIHPMSREYQKIWFH